MLKNEMKERQSWILIKYGRMLTFTCTMNHTQSHNNFMRNTNAAVCQNNTYAQNVIEIVFKLKLYLIQRYQLINIEVLGFVLFLLVYYYTSIYLSSIL